MPVNFDTLLNAILALLSILNPITVVPLYSELTKDLAKKDRNRLFNTAVFAGFLTLFILMFTGRWVMETIFQIHMAEFRIAGGIMLIVIAVKQIAFYNPEEYQASPGKVMEMGVVPMAVPLLVGPGAIVTSILVLDRDGWVIASLALLANLAVAWVVVRFSPALSRIMGRFGTLVIARILWIFIAAIGAHFLLTGVGEVFGISLPIFQKGF
jgi:multiple antibiotic resistance protein